MIANPTSPPPTFVHLHEGISGRTGGAPDNSNNSFFHFFHFFAKLLCGFSKVNNNSPDCRFMGTKT
jgi:hypothetical protein